MTTEASKSLSDEEINEIALQVVYGGDDQIPMRADWCEEVGRPFARAIEAKVRASQASAQPPVQQKGERERFESNFIGCHQYRDGGDYSMMECSSGWEAWQAALASAPHSAAPEAQSQAVTKEDAQWEIRAPLRLALLELTRSDGTHINVFDALNAIDATLRAALQQPVSGK